MPDRENCCGKCRDRVKVLPREGRCKPGVLHADLDRDCSRGSFSLLERSASAVAEEISKSIVENHGNENEETCLNNGVCRTGNDRDHHLGDAEDGGPRKDRQYLVPERFV